MTHIANQRIKMGGKLYMPGDPIVPSEDDLKELPKGAVSLADGNDTAVEPVSPSGPELTEEFRLKTAVDALTDADFKKDGFIRADSLKDLVAKLGFEVTAEEIAAVKVNGGD